MKTVRIILPVVIALIGGFLLRGCFISGSTQTAAGEQKPTIWTCSMHPQIQLPKPGKCPICFMDLIPLGESGTEGGERELSISANAAKRMELETAPVERRFAEAEVRMVGKVAYDETRVSYISAWVPGRIDRLFVDYTGIPVKEGEHLAELYSPDLLTAQEELLQAIATLDNLKESQSTLLRETAAQTVSAARDKLRLWGFTAAQINAIEQRGAPSDHMTIYSPASGIVIHKKAQEGMYVQTGTLIYTIADLSRVWILLDAYESDLSLLRYGSRVEFSTETYPGETFAGTITFIDPVINPTTRTAKVRVIIDNADNKLKPGMFVRAIARPRIGTDEGVMNPDLAGKWISPMHPEIVKDEPGSCDVCGMPLVPAESLGYVTDDKETPLLVPASAVLKTGKRAVVYVELPDRETPTYEGREVELGMRLGEVYIVKSGLEEGDRVVTRGAFKLDAELQIQARPSMMSMPSEESAANAQPMPQTHCPVMGGEINKDIYMRCRIQGRSRKVYCQTARRRYRAGNTRPTANALPGDGRRDQQGGLHRLRRHAHLLLLWRMRCRIQGRSRKIPEADARERRGT
jgi:Cu(I)/Ag(I) efflux system membrane fusion protein